MNLKTKQNWGVRFFLELWLNGENVFGRKIVAAETPATTGKRMETKLSTAVCIFLTFFFFCSLIFRCLFGLHVQRISTWTQFELLNTYIWISSLLKIALFITFYLSVVEMKDISMSVDNILLFYLLSIDYFISLLLQSFKNLHSESRCLEKCINVSVQCKATQSLQLSSQLFYYLAVNIWPAYFGSAIPLSFIMPCDYIFIAYCICLILLLSALHPLTFFFFKSPCSSSFLHHHSPTIFPSATPPPLRLPPASASLFAEVAVPAVTLTK